MPGKKVVILGSGDIGLIMARRFILEGAKVEAVVEVMPYPAGLARNIAQCLEDFSIPLYLRSTVTKIHGRERVEGVTISEVDDNWQPIKGTERHIPCDTLLLSVGLIPENELSLTAEVPLDPRTRGAIVDENRETAIPGIFAAGNVLHVHDLVDYVSDEAEIAGKAAAEYALKEPGRNGEIPARKKQVFIRPGENISYVLPQRLTWGQEAELYLRVSSPLDAVTLELGDIAISRRRLVKPSEMMKLRLRQEHWEKLPGPDDTELVLAAKVPTKPRKGVQS